MPMGLRNGTPGAPKLRLGRPKWSSGRPKWSLGVLDAILATKNGDKYFRPEVPGCPGGSQAPQEGQGALSIVFCKSNWHQASKT